MTPLHRRAAHANYASLQAPMGNLSAQDIVNIANDNGASNIERLFVAEEKRLAIFGEALGLALGGKNLDEHRTREGCEEGALAENPAGSSPASSTPLADCLRCHGTGKAKYSQGDQSYEECHDCRGTGKA